MPHAALDEDPPSPLSSDVTMGFCIVQTSLEASSKLPEICEDVSREHEPLLLAPDLDQASADAEPAVMVVDMLLESFESAWMGGANSSKPQTRRSPTPSYSATPDPVHPMLIPANRAAASIQHCGLKSSSSQRSSDTETSTHFAPSTPYHSNLLCPPLGNGVHVPHSAPLPAPETPSGPAVIPTKSEFASVFFSPIPLSYLGINRCESIDSNPASSPGSLGSAAEASFKSSQGLSGLCNAGANPDWPEVSQHQDTRAAGSAIPSTSPHNLDLSSPLAPGAQRQREPLSNGKRKAQSPDSVLEAAAGRSPQQQEQQQEQEPQQQQQQQQARQSKTAPVPVMSARPVERSSDTPSPSTFILASTAAGSTPISQPLAPAGMHPILSRPPASASTSPAFAAPILSCVAAPAPAPLPTPPTQAATSMLVDLPLPLPSTHLLHAPIPLPSSMTIAAAARAASPALPSSAPRPPLRLVVGSSMIPHVDKVDKGGEDALCVCMHGLGAIGVADGVSGWAEEGIDPAAYSRSLMSHASDALDRTLQQQGPLGTDPREVIRYAHQCTVMAGSSTICVAVMKPQGKMHVGNLGDSGVRLIRDGRTLFASAAQQHMFNMPFQLSHPSIIESPDDADSADVSVLDVLPGDIVVMATDGLYDNVFDEEIAGICTHMSGTLGGSGYSQAAAQAMAAAVAQTAHRYALDPRQRTPWSVAACETGMPWARFFAKGGGKMDDVTVLVAFVVEDAS